MNWDDPEGYGDAGPIGPGDPVIGVKLPLYYLKYRPRKSENAPIGVDNHSVHLHHRNQNPMGPIDELLQVVHQRIRHKKPSDVDHDDPRWKKFKRRYWIAEYRSGRFDSLPLDPGEGKRSPVKYPPVLNDKPVVPMDGEIFEFIAHVLEGLKP